MNPCGITKKQEEQHLRDGKKSKRKTSKALTTFEVSVEKRMYATGIVTVKAKTADQAVQMVQDQIVKGELQTTAVDWGDPEYEDDSFMVTWDVDEV